MIMTQSISVKNFKLRYSEIDYDTVLKPSALLQFLQDVASENAEELGFGYSYIVRKNLAWFLLKYHIEFDDYPRGMSDLKIKTNPRGYNKLFAYRDFEIFSNDKLIGRASSTWALVDLEMGGMRDVADELGGNPHMIQFEKRDNDLKYEKVKPPEKIDKEHIFEIRFDDLDVNQHVNNVNYIVWAFEPLDFEFRKAKKLKTLDMVFKKEVKYGNKIISQVEISGDCTNHILKRDDEELCLIKAQWVNK